MRRLLGIAVFLAGMSVPALTAAHPHVWVTGGADFGLDAEGRLARLHVTWIYDEFASLYLLNAMGADADGDRVLTGEEKARIIADQTTWEEDFEGDSYLWLDGDARALGGPENADTRILDSGQVEVTFQRPLVEPFRPAAGVPVVAKVYDPGFYYAYEVTSAPAVIAPAAIGAADHRCSAELRPVDADDPALKALEVKLSALGAGDTPDQADVGALFADELRLTCE